jgi:hypothetical protein
MDMIKKAYIGLIVVIAVVVITSAAFAYNEGMLGEPGQLKSPGNSTPSANAYVGPVSAFKALSMAEDSSVVREWTSKNSKTSVEGISTQVCDSGLASSWTIVYVGDSEQAFVEVNDGMVNLTIENGAHSSYVLDTGNMIDSDKACSIALDALKLEGYSPTGLTSIELGYVEQYKGIWDISYPIGTDYYIVRMDAMTGTIVEKAHIGYLTGNGQMVGPGL